MATFWAGLDNRADDTELCRILEVANEYRVALCDLQQKRHEQTIDFRNEQFPALYAALVQWEAAKSQVFRLDKSIKALNSEVRDRNTVPKAERDPEFRRKLAELKDLAKSLGRDLRAARKERTRTRAAVLRRRKSWSAMLLGFKKWWAKQADWQNVKALEKRRRMYEDLRCPKGPKGEYAQLWMELDLLERELDKSFSGRVHSATRAEIRDASQPKRGKDSPGIRYWYGIKPEPRTWTKLTVQFSNGLSVAEALAGESKKLSLRPLWINHKARGDETVYQVRQQIGTSEQPCVLEYMMRAHRPLPQTALIRLWSVATRGRKMVCIPIFSGLPGRPRTGRGTLSYRLRWTKRPEGVEVAHFWGPHVNERVIVPNWLVERVMCVKEEQAAADALANERLAEFGIVAPPGGKQGVEYLAARVEAGELDQASSDLLDKLELGLYKARKISARGVRCIEAIYETVACRVCELHAEIRHDPIDLAKIKRYSSRDLLKEDKLPAASREILHAVAPGKLRAKLKANGLQASDQEPGEPPVNPRTSDLWTTWVLNLRRKLDPKLQRPRRRSRCGETTAMAQ